MSDALFRLVGDGDRHSGGAIPLPDAFSAVVNELLDHGDADFRRLNHLISDALRYKEERVMAAAWRTWPQFTRDVLSVLEDMNLIKENQSGKWELTEEFVSGYTFYLPGTDIGFTGRNKADRERRNSNETLHMALNAAVIAIRDRAGDGDPEAVRLILEAEKILVHELGLDKPPPKLNRYQQHAGRKPHQRGKRLRSGMTGFFRDFWDKYAEDGKWYDLAGIGRKFEELHPDQPAISHSGDLMGSMRKTGRDMTGEGSLETRKVLGNGSWKREYRKKNTTVLPGYAGNATVVPVVTWEGLKGDPKA